MRYRVIREIGGDYVVGADVDGAAFLPTRLRQLVEQRRLEPIAENPADLSPAELADFRAWQESQAARDDQDQEERETRAEQEAAVAALTSEPEQLRAELAEAHAAPAPAGEATGAESPHETGPSPAESQDAPPALRDMGIDTLRKLASERDVSGRSGMTKEQLVAALEALEALEVAGKEDGDGE